MLFIGIITIGILSFQTIHTTFSPAALRARAALNNHKAKVLANALKAHAHYNAALARTNLGLLEHRVIRNSNDPIEDIQDLVLNNSFDDDDEHMSENINDEILSSAAKDEQRLFPVLFGPNLQNEKLVVDEKRSLSPQLEETYQQIDDDCANSDLESNTDKLNFLKIPLDNIDSKELDNAINLESKMNLGEQEPENFSLNNKGSFEPPADETLEDSILGMQPSLQQGFVGPPQYSPQILLPMPYIQQGMPMPYLPQGNSFQYYPVPQIPTYPPRFGPQLILMRPSLQPNNDDYSGFQTPSLQPLKNPNRATNSHFHTHSSGDQDTLPTNQIVTSKANLHVTEEENATTQPGFSPDNTPFPPGNNQGGPFIAHFVPSPGEGPVKSNIGNNPSLPIKEYLVLSSGTGNAYNQPQTFYTKGNSVVGMKHDDNLLDNQWLNYLNPDLEGIDNENVGTFVKDHSIKAPESPKNFDPNRPQNLQPVVNYIKTEERNLKKMLESIDHNEKFVHNFPLLNLHKELEFLTSPNQNEESDFDETNMSYERLGAFSPFEEIQIPSVPSLPTNFLELNQDEKSGAIKNYLEEEHKNVQKILEQIDESNTQNVNKFASLLFSDPSTIFNPPSVPRIENVDHNEEMNNVNNVPLELPRFDYGMKPNDDGMLTKFIENNRAIQEDINEKDLDANPNLGNIIDIPQNHESEWYQRFMRSVNGSNTNKLDKLLQAEKGVVNELKKHAKHDEDLMMIEHLESSMLEDLEKKMNKTKRNKREIDTMHNSPINRLINDPKTKLDMPKTLDNLGVATKNFFEHEEAPLYHIRNMIGSAQDAILATIKIPTKNVLLPSQYEITNKELVGDINSRILKEKTMQEESTTDDIARTFHKVGTAIRSSVLSSQEALSHVGHAANHAKSAIHSTKHATPRLTSNRLLNTARQPERKTILITPRIFDLIEEEQVGNTLDDSEDQFVKVGDILDAVGVSNPSSNDVQFEQIIIDPKGNMVVEKFDEDENTLGSTLSTLDNIRESLGVGNLKDLISKVKQDMNQVFMTIIPNKQLEVHPVVEIKPTSNNKKIQTHNNKTVDVEKYMNMPQVITPNQVGQNHDILEATMIPENLLHPFMGQVSQTQLDHLWNETQMRLGSERSERDEDLGQILGAVNPIMFERMFNKSLKPKSTETPHSVFNRHKFNEAVSEDDNNNEQVGTNMRLYGEMLKPFMGRASDKAIHDFFHKYMPDSDESGSDESREFKKLAEVPDLEGFDETNGSYYEE